MSSRYDAVAARALAMIGKKGAPILFLADAWKGGSIATDVVGSGVEIPGDPDEYRALNLVASNPVTVLVAGKDLGITPAPGVAFRWAARPYTVKTATPVAPEGVAADGTGVILWTLIGAS